MRMFAIFVLLLSLNSGQSEDSLTLRKRELEPLLKALQWKAAPTKSPSLESAGNPGWYNPKNRQAIAGFIGRYPGTEEAILAEVWLIFAKADTDRSHDMSEIRRWRAEDAKALERIIKTTRRRGIAKLAKILRALELSAAQDYNQVKEQIGEILRDIKEYQSEKDSEYLRFFEVEGTPLVELEPYMRRCLLISECHQKHFAEALKVAEELQAKFPDWSKRESVQEDIEALKKGRSRYLTWEELKERTRVGK